jgi:hypothetical protein
MIIWPFVRSLEVRPPPLNIVGQNGWECRVEERRSGAFHRDALRNPSKLHTSASRQTQPPGVFFGEVTEAQVEEVNRL